MLERLRDSNKELSRAELIARENMREEVRTILERLKESLPEDTHNTINEELEKL